MRLAVDTNLLAYAEGVNGQPKRQMALSLLRRLPRSDTAIPVQVLGELFNVLVRKARRPLTDARAAVLNWHNAFATIETSPPIMLAATDLAATHQLAIWDCVIICAAAERGCRLLLSEDLQDGFTWKGTTVANPFAATPHPLLDAALNKL